MHAQAAVQDGGVKSAIVGLGTNGKYPSNMERDLRRKLRKELGIETQPYPVETSVWHNGSLVIKHQSAILPHVLFADLCAYNPALFNHILFCNRGHVEFWKLAEHSQEQWWLEHPLREHILREPERCIPYRIFGDEISLGKNNRPTLGMLWCGSVARMKAMLMKLLLFHDQVGPCDRDGSDLPSNYLVFQLPGLRHLANYGYGWAPL